MKDKFIKYNIFKSFAYAFCGIYIVFKREANPRIQLITGLVCISISLYIQNNVFAAIHLVLMLLTISQEIMNTALEEFCDMVEPNYNLVVKRVKDMAAGSVLVGSLAWIFVIAFQIVLNFMKYRVQSIQISY